jgi:drug/metabolite transporter (DMT)-like permease
LSRLQAVAGMLGVAFCYALVPLIIHVAHRVAVPVADLLAAQFLTGLAAAVIYAAVRRRTWWPSAGNRRPWIVVGLLIAATDIAYYRTLALLPVPEAVLLLFQFPWMAIGLEALRARRRPTRLEGIVAAVMWAGTVLALDPTESAPGHVSIAGAVWGLLAALGYAATLVAATRLPSHVPVEMRLGPISLAGFLAACLLLLGQPRLSLPVLWLGPVLGLVGFVLPTALMVAVGPFLTGSWAAALAAAELPMATVLGAWWLHQRVGLRGWAGIGLVLAAVILAGGRYAAVRRGGSRIGR